MQILTRSPATNIPVAVALVLAAAIALAVSTLSGGAQADHGEGWLEVGRSRYEFVPSSCTFNNTDFVAAGSGTFDGTPFWVTASAGQVSLAMGTDSELERPPADQLWLTSVGPVEWDVDGSTISARAELADRRIDSDKTVDGSLSVSCTTTATQG